MIAMLRVAVFWAIALTVVYFLVAIYSRSVRREWLEKKYDAGGIEGERHDYIEAGMQAYEQGLRRKLLWLVYIIPTVVVGVTIYFVNYQ
jgi:ABC-type multidrug transport system permease subunit